MHQTSGEPLQSCGRHTRSDADPYQGSRSSSDLQAYVDELAPRGPRCAAQFTAPGRSRRCRASSCRKTAAPVRWGALGAAPCRRRSRAECCTEYRAYVAMYTRPPWAVCSTFLFRELSLTNIRVIYRTWSGLPWDNDLTTPRAIRTRRKQSPYRWRR